MQVKIGGFAAFCITMAVVGGVVSCVEAICNRPSRKSTESKPAE